jgi:hypothetical protein
VRSGAEFRRDSASPFIDPVRKRVDVNIHTIPVNTVIIDIFFHFFLFNDNIEK